MTHFKFFKTVKNNYLLAELFDYDPSFLEDIQLYVEQFEDMPGEDIANNAQWLYKGDGTLTVMLGLYKNNIIAISEDFELFKFCDYFQDIPFEIYRRHYGIFRSFREEYITKLKQYEQWCRDHGIAVDPDNHYHDKYGNIFSEYFELDYDQSIIGIY